MAVTLAGMKRIAILGGGRMGEALLMGLLNGGYEASAISIAEQHLERCKEIEKNAPGVTVGADASRIVAGADLVIVAVKPNDVGSVLEGARDSISTSACILSIAAGITIADLESLVPGRAVIRAMPNTPALVGRGATAIVLSVLATDEDAEMAEQVLGYVGIVERVTEDLIDAVTGLSGSGPAYIFLVIEALVDAGIQNGLPRELVERLVEQTVAGSIELLMASSEGPIELRAQVTSPGGTTAEGIRALAEHGLRAAITDAVTKAKLRSIELGRRD